MADKEYAPLSAVCVRTLNDKLYEKRKQGALEIERMMKEFVQQNQDGQVKKVLKILGEDFAGSSNPNTRKGGLIGLAAAAIALGKDSSVYVNELVKPVLACFRDQDSRVRYYSCEALYNIVKVTRGSMLPFFNEIFDALSKLAADPDQNVKNGTDLLDRLIKDIVSESSSFDLVAFIPLLRERIYTQNQFARQFIVSWVATLDAVPDINMLVLLPEILDGLLNILGDTSPEIKKMCQNVLSEFLSGIKKSQSSVNFAGMANILIVHSQNSDDVISYTAINWLREFVQLAGRAMLPFLSGILQAILPSLASTEIETKSKKSVKEAAEGLNAVLMNLVDEVDDNPTPAIGSPSDSRVESKQGEVTNDIEMKQMQEADKKGPVDNALDTYHFVTPSCFQLDVASTIKVLCQLLEHAEFQTRIASLRWFVHLLNKVPKKTFRYMSQIFPVLLGTLADEKQSDEAVLLGLQALAEISTNPAGQSAIDNLSSNTNSPVKAVTINEVNSLENSSESENTNSIQNDCLQKGDSNCVENTPRKSASESKTLPNEYFTKFMVCLMDLFKKDRSLLQKRGPFIIRQLCLLISSEDIFRSLSEILVSEIDVKFACLMVQTLNTILLTSTELYELRNQLKDLASRESCVLFSCLYKSWCHSPVATISLCFLTQNYSHASKLLPIFGSLEITVDFLNEIDKLIQLIESPIFAYLRLQLLDSDNSQELIKSLYGLLMLLPQSEAFQLLRRRLNCIPNFHLASVSQSKPYIDPREHVRDIDFDSLLEHFKTVQERHREARKRHTAFLLPYNNL